MIAGGRLPGLPGRLPPALRRCAEAAAAVGDRRHESVYLVGGCVRDLLLGSDLRDLDLVVEGEPVGFATDLAAALGGRVRAVSRFGTCEVQAPGGVRVDVAMSRRERYDAPAALPSVSSAPIEEDLLRRDFTIHSMALRLGGPGSGRILDPSGGRGDLEARRLRLHHAASLVDDPTRALRAARYAARYSLRADAGWGAALRAARRARAFERLSPARLRREVALVWSEPDPARVLRLCGRWGLLAHIHPRLRWTAPLARAVRRASARRGRSAGQGASAEILPALLAWSLPSAARRALAARLGIEGAARDRLVQAAVAPARWSRARRAGFAAARAEADLARGGGGRASLAREVLECVMPSRERRRAERSRRIWEAAAPILTGDDLLDLGVPRGPRVGSILRTLRAARLRGRVRTRAGEAALVRRILSDPGAQP